MQTDDLLRRLGALRAVDLLPLLGDADATLVRAESIELASRAHRLDLVLHLRTRAGREYIHIVEWQGYRKDDLLQRTMRYIAEITEQQPTRPVLCTIVYLIPESDTGGVVGASIPGLRGGWQFTVDTIKLWEIDAKLYLDASPGLAVLTPLMRGATPDTVFAVAQRVLEEAETSERAELIDMLSVFATALVEPEVIIGLIGKENLMTTGIISILVREQMDEYRQQSAKQDQQHVILLLSRLYPDLPLRVMHEVEQITDVDTLNALMSTLLRTTDPQAAVAAIAAARG